MNRQIYDEFMSTGAIVAGRGTFEPAGGWGGDHHGGVPIYILSRHPAPSWAADWPGVHYVNDLEAAMREAKAAAGDKNVLVHGASTAQRALNAGLLDELEIHLIPVLLGEGRPLFEHLGVEQRELERIRVLEGDGGVTHLRFRVAGVEVRVRSALRQPAALHVAGWLVSKLGRWTRPRTSTNDDRSKPAGRATRPPPVDKMFPRER